MPEKSSIDFHHLLQDLVDSYNVQAWEAALIEIVANCLDAKCSQIEIVADLSQMVLEVCDNGQGMSEADFHDYHDVAVSRKRKGTGIGYAGLGAKLSLWVSNHVITETRSRNFHGASKWWLEGRDLWHDPVPQRTLGLNGTKTTLSLKQVGLPLLRPGEVQRIITTHYYPLFDPFLAELYRITQVYPAGVRLIVNEQELKPDGLFRDEAVRERYEFPLEVMQRRTRRILGRGYFVLSERDLEEPGIIISTKGKVIKRGEWFKKFPRDMARISGIVEAPYLANSLTLNKLDFIGEGDAGKNWRHFFREMQKLFGEWLEQVGRLEKKREPAEETEALEKEISEILSAVPELQTIFAKPTVREVSVPGASGQEAFTSETGTQVVPGTRRGTRKGEGVDVPPGLGNGSGLGKPAEQGITGIRVPRKIQLGPNVGIESYPNLLEPAFVSGDKVVINSAHPAYEKAQNRGFMRYHQLISIAWALTMEKGAESANEALALLAKFLSAWGKL